MQTSYLFLLKFDSSQLPLCAFSKITPHFKHFSKYNGAVSFCIHLWECLLYFQLQPHEVSSWTVAIMY